MKTYYQQLKPIVLAHVQHYQTDFTVHDRKSLHGYTGELYYAIRKTGTDLFRINTMLEAITNLLNEKPDNYFTSKGLGQLLTGNYSAFNGFSVNAILHRENNQRFFIGKDGKITEYPFQRFETLFRKRLEEIDSLALQLKGSRFVYELELEVYNQEEKRRKENYQPSPGWQFAHAVPS